MAPPPGPPPDSLERRTMGASLNLNFPPPPPDGSMEAEGEERAREFLR